MADFYSLMERQETQVIVVKLSIHIALMHCSFGQQRPSGCESTALVNFVILQEAQHPQLI